MEDHCCFGGIFGVVFFCLSCSAVPWVPFFCFCPPTHRVGLVIGVARFTDSLNSFFVHSSVTHSLDCALTRSCSLSQNGLVLAIRALTRERTLLESQGQRPTTFSSSSTSNPSAGSGRGGRTSSYGPSEITHDIELLIGNLRGLGALYPGLGESYLLILGLVPSYCSYPTPTPKSNVHLTASRIPPTRRGDPEPGASTSEEGEGEGKDLPGLGLVGISALPVGANRVLVEVDWIRLWGWGGMGMIDSIDACLRSS